MKKIVFYLICILIIGIRCNQRDNTNEEIIKEVESLTTDNQKKVFLDEIHELDQEVRKNLNEVEMKYGYDSNEKKEAMQNVIRNDQINLQKMELYLKKYGHPTKDKHGEYASGTPWIVIHHSGNLESRERNFQYLFEAYKKSDLDPGSFSFYLERFHRMKYGKRFTLPNPYRQEQLIDSLIKRLELRVFTE